MARMRPTWRPDASVPRGVHHLAGSGSTAAIRHAGRRAAHRGSARPRVRATGGPHERWVAPRQTPRQLRRRRARATAARCGATPTARRVPDGPRTPHANADPARSAARPADRRSGRADPTTARRQPALARATRRDASRYACVRIPRHRRDVGRSSASWSVLRGGCLASGLRRRAISALVVPRRGRRRR